MLTIGYRIVGVEDSYKIIASEIDSATLKLYTLVEVVKRLIKKIRRYTSGG